MVISQHKPGNNTVEFSAFVAPGIFAMSRGCCVTYIEELRGVIRQLRGVESQACCVPRPRFIRPNIKGRPFWNSDFHDNSYLCGQAS
jgi:hypothetical protein